MNSSMQFARKALVVGSLAALVLAGGEPSYASVERIGVCKIPSTRVRCDASGTVRHPRRLRMRVTSRPHYGVSGDWTAVCFKWSQRRRRTGWFVEENPFVRRIPMTFWRPDRCRVRVSLAAGFDALMFFGSGPDRFAKLLLQSRV